MNRETERQILATVKELKNRYHQRLYMMMKFRQDNAGNFNETVEKSGKTGYNISIDGGPGSGNWGHGGRPGKRGGSGEGGGKQHRYETPSGGFTSRAQAEAENRKWNKAHGIKQPNSKPKADIVQKAIGAKRGAPISVIEAAKGANPNYKRGIAFQKNCQRCVATYEMRRRGYDVEAKPIDRNNSPIVFGSEVFVDKAGKPVRHRFGRTRRQVETELKNAPDGARYSIYVIWKSDRSKAHVFVAEKVGNTVRYIDPQNGDLDVSGYLDRAVPNEFGYLRMDNLDIKPDMLDYTMEAK